jgi:CRP/FNR family transcriptional regulator, cyclic AMP receptor protein
VGRPQRRQEGSFSLLALDNVRSIGEECDLCSPVEVWEDARVPMDTEALRKSEVFSALSPEQLAKLAEAAQVTQHAAGETLTEEGAIGYRFYLLLEGSAIVERGGEEVAAIGAGDFVGEIALLGGGRSTATVRCQGPTRCLTLRREEFWAVLEAEPAIALRILEVVARRLERELRPDSRANLPGS